MDQGIAFGIGKTMMMNNRDGHHESQRDRCIVRRDGDGAFDRAMHTILMYLG